MNIKITKRHILSIVGFLLIVAASIMVYYRDYAGALLYIIISQIAVLSR